MNSINTTITDVWDRHPDEIYRQDQSHYRGVGRWADDEAWLNIGNAARRRVSELWGLLGRTGTPQENLNILEWGPGGGANAYGLKDICSKFYGVDISEKNLIEAGRVLGAETVPGFFHPVLLAGDPASVTASIPPEIDIFFSTAVFQHFPSREYGREVLESIRNVCRDSAAGFIQIRFDNGIEKYKGIQGIEDYRARHIFANSYPLDVFWDLTMSAGFRPLYINAIRKANNYATFYLSAT